MKKLKRAFIGITALTMAFSAAAIASACGGNDGGSSDEVSGNYTQVDLTQEGALNEAIKDSNVEISKDKIFGDATAENYKFGIELAVDLEAGAHGDNIIDADGKISAKYGVLMDNNVLSGGGEAKVEYNISGQLPGLTEELKGDYSAVSKIDGGFVYGSYKEGDGVAQAAKVNYVRVMEAVSEIMPMTYNAAPTESDGADSQSALGEYLGYIADYAKQYNLALSMDTSDGVKVKVSATEDTVKSILKSFAVSVTDEMIIFNSFKIDAYLAIDNSGAISQASVILDVDIKIDMGAGMPDEYKEQAVAMPVIEAFAKGSVVLKANKDVTIGNYVIENAANAEDKTDYVIGLIGNGKIWGDDDDNDWGDNIGNVEWFL